MKCSALFVLLFFAGACSPCVVAAPQAELAPAAPTLEQHRAHIETMLQQLEDEWVKNDGSRPNDQRFRLAAEEYIAGIEDLAMLEALFYNLNTIDPWEHHLQAWSDGLETFFYYIVRDIAKRGSKEAYDVFIRIKQYRCDGAWAGTLRSLEWKYFRQYSQDPRVLESKNGVFH